MKEESGHGAVLWVRAEDGDVGAWMEAVDEAGSRRGGDFDAEGACGDATVGGDGDGGAEAASAARSAGMRFCQSWWRRSILPLACGVGA